MGLWDRQIEHLWSIGIRIGDLERQWMESPPEGARVLHLHPLFDPTTAEGSIRFMEDENGQTVWKAETITVLDPFQEEGSGYGPKRRTHRLLDEMEQQFGSLSQAYPVYFGMVSDECSDYDQNVEFMRRDEPHPYPFWTCLPLMSQIEMDAAKEVVHASNLRLRNSIYDDLWFIVDIEQGSEMCISADEVWRQENDPNWAPSKYAEQDADYESMAWEQFENPEGMRSMLVDALQRLIDYGYVLNPKYSLEQHERMGTQFKPFTIEPIEAFLDQPNLAAQMGLDMWRSIRARTDLVHHRVVSIHGDIEAYRMSTLEGATQ